MSVYIKTRLEQYASNNPTTKKWFYRETSFRSDSIENAMRKLRNEHRISPAKKICGVFVGDKTQIGFINRQWIKEDDKNIWVESWITFTQIEEKPAELPKYLISNE